MSKLARFTILLGSRRLLAVTVLVFLALWALLVVWGFLAPVDLALLIAAGFAISLLSQRATILRTERWQERTKKFQANFGDFGENPKFAQIKLLLPRLASQMGVRPPPLVVYPSSEIGYQVVLGRTLCVSEARLTTTIEEVSSESLNETLLLGHELAHLKLNHDRNMKILSFFIATNRVMVLGLLLGLFSSGFYDTYWWVVPILALGLWFSTLDLVNLISHAEEFEADRLCAQTFGPGLAHAINLLYYQNAVIVSWSNPDWLTRQRVMKVLAEVVRVEPVVAQIRSGYEVFTAATFLASLRMLNQPSEDSWTNFTNGNQSFLFRLRSGFLETHPSCVDRWWALAALPNSSANDSAVHAE